MEISYRTHARYCLASDGCLSILTAQHAIVSHLVGEYAWAMGNPCFSAHDAELEIYVAEKN